MSPASGSGMPGVRRSVCAHCLRAQSACICAWVVALQPLVQVVILQHPLEQRQAKGSARLLHLCLTGSELHVGERFDEGQLQSLLHVSGSHTLLLYPGEPPSTGEPTPKEPTGAVPALPPVMPAQDLPRQPCRLIVLDGTWRKSRKMLHCNPLLQALPRLSLQGLQPSRYRVRKAHRADQMATLEATAHALAQLEQDGAKYAPLLAAFDGFVGQLAQHG